MCRKGKQKDVCQGPQNTLYPLRKICVVTFKLVVFQVWNTWTLLFMIVAALWEQSRRGRSTLLLLEAKRVRANHPRGSLSWDLKGGDGRFIQCLQPRCSPSIPSLLCGHSDTLCHLHGSDKLPDIHPLLLSLGSLLEAVLQVQGLKIKS